MVTPMLIFIPTSSGGGDIIWSEAGTILAVVLLIIQYAFIVIFVYFEDHFRNKLHAITWLIPGWPILELAYSLITKFWRL